MAYLGWLNTSAAMTTFHPIPNAVEIAAVKNGIIEGK